MNVKISVFVICVETKIYICYYIICMSVPLKITVILLLITYILLLLTYIPDSVLERFFEI